MSKILLIDDDNEIYNLLKMSLGKTYELSEINWIEDPVNQVLEYEPKLILLDLNIPKIGGKATLDQLKKNEATRDIPVYFFSADAEIENITKETSADGYISKPFKLKELKRLLEQELQE